jgi:hypothetical protein
LHQADSQCPPRTAAGAAAIFESDAFLDAQKKQQKNTQKQNTCKKQKSPPQNKRKNNLSLKTNRKKCQHAHPIINK